MRSAHLWSAHLWISIVFEPRSQAAAAAEDARAALLRVEAALAAREAAAAEAFEALRRQARQLHDSGRTEEAQVTPPWSLFGKAQTKHTCPHMSGHAVTCLGAHRRSFSCMHILVYLSSEIQNVRGEFCQVKNHHEEP